MIRWSKHNSTFPCKKTIGELETTLQSCIRNLSLPCLRLNRRGNVKFQEKWKYPIILSKNTVHLLQICSFFWNGIRGQNEFCRTFLATVEKKIWLTFSPLLFFSQSGPSAIFTFPFFRWPPPRSANQMGTLTQINTKNNQFISIYIAIHQIVLICFHHHNLTVMNKKTQIMTFSLQKKTPLCRLRKKKHSEIRWFMTGRYQTHIQGWTTSILDVCVCVCVSNQGKNSLNLRFCDPPSDDSRPKRNLVPEGRFFSGGL